jgi:phosphatidylcholine synthase
VTALRTIAAWAVHLYTASGALCAFFALESAIQGHVRAAFLWLCAQVAIDSSDGALARRVCVKTVLPGIDGTRLDDIVDYLAYVFVPAVMVVSTGVVPAPIGWVVAGAMLVSSALGFSSAQAKTEDHFFTGFPSYWNVVVLYLVAFRGPPSVNATILLALAVLVFVPVRYVYPSRTPVFQPVTLVLGSVWALLMLGVVVSLPDAPRALLYPSLVFPGYYIVLSFVLDARRRTAGGQRA